MHRPHGPSTALSTRAVFPNLESRGDQLVAAGLTGLENHMHGAQAVVKNRVCNFIDSENDGPVMCGAALGRRQQLVPDDLR